MGRLAVIDGLDGSGKTTQLEAVDRLLTDRGIPHQVISFPDYSQPSSALVRQYLAGEFGGTPQAVGAYAASSFYAVDRYASFKRFWERAYEENRWIIAARYTTSNAIHQMPKLPKSEWDGFLRWLYDYEYHLLGLPHPDAVVFLDMPPEVSQRLVSGRYGGDERRKDIHERDAGYLQACREAALYAAKEGGWRVISCADGELPRPKEEVTGEIASLLEELL